MKDLRIKLTTETIFTYTEQAFKFDKPRSLEKTLDLLNSTQLYSHAAI